METIYVKVTNDVPDEYTNRRPVKFKTRINNRIEKTETNNQIEEIEINETANEDDQFDDMANNSNDNSSDASSDVSTEDLSDEGKKKRLFEMIDDINETEMKIHGICSSKCPDIAEILMTRMIRSLKRYRKLYEDIYGPINKKDGKILIVG